MQIFWHGYSSVRIESKNGDQECTLLTDPFENESSLRFPRTIEPDVLVLSHQNQKQFNQEAVNGKPYTISNPGEYEVRGVFIQGVQDAKADEGKERPVMYRFISEGMNIAFLGAANRKPTNDEIEALGNVDILLLPVGGGNVLEAKQAAELVTSMEPRIVVPLYYDLKGIKQKLSGVDAFVKAVGGADREDMNRLKILKKDLPPENVLIAVIERS